MKSKRNISLIIIEDEPHNSRMLRGMVEELRPDWKVAAILESVEESVGWLRKNPAPDLILADIQLSDGISFSIFQQVETEPTSRIIFTTAYDEYAIRAFKVNSIDYLLKPVKRDDLENAFIKFEQLWAQNRISPQTVKTENEHLKQLIESIVKGKKEYRTRFLISGIQSYTRLETKNIAFIYSNNKLTFAVDYGKKEYTLDYSLEELEQELDPDRFFRANRKIIVNIEAVKKINNETGGKLSLITDPGADFEIIISRLKAQDFKNWLGK